MTRTRIQNRKSDSAPRPDKGAVSPDPQGEPLTRAPRRPLIVHFTETYSSGVSSIIDEYVDLTATEFEHEIVAFRRESIQTGDRGGVTNVTTIRSRLGLIIAGRSVLRRRDVSIVHAHSSIGGWIVRAFRRTGDPAVVFSPHCFLFERTSNPAFVAIVRGLERLLSGQSAVVVGCSEREEILARQLGAKVAIHVPQPVPLIHQSDAGRVIPEFEPRGHLNVVMVGRICRQKGPDFMEQLAQECHRLGFKGSLRWVGDGSPRMVRRLRGAGVDVTGWLPRVDVLRILGDSDVYVHTAEWEGFPVTLLEAAAVGLAALARRIPALIEFPEENQFEDPRALAEYLVALELDRDRVNRIRDRTKDWLDSRPTKAQIGETLTKVYAVANQTEGRDGFGHP